MIPLTAWKTFKLIAIKNIARRSTVHSFIILEHKKHFILWSNTRFEISTSTTDEDSKKHYIRSDKTPINHGKTQIKSRFVTKRKSVSYKAA